MPLKISEITAGQTLYYSKTDNRQKRRDKVYHHPLVNYRFFVLKVNVAENTIIASCNGAPGELFQSKNFSRWTKEKPAQ